MRTFWLAAAAVVCLTLAAPAASAQPILKRVEDLLRDQLDAARRDQPAERGYLGMIGDDTVDNSGVRLLEVYPNQPAAQGGLLAGDIIIKIDGRSIATMDEMLAALGDRPVGAKLPMTVLRDGEKKELEVTLGTRPSSSPHELPEPPPAEQPPAAAPRPRLGVRSVPVTAEVQRQHNLAEASGAHVISVTTDSPAARAGIPLGAVITAVNNSPVRTPQELAAAISSTTQPEVALTFVHAGRTQQVTAKLVEMPSAGGPLLETRARPPQPADVAPAIEPPPAKPVESSFEALDRRVRELEARIKQLEAKLPPE